LTRALLLLAVVACKKSGPIEVALPEPVDPWSPAALQAYVDEIAPLVEEHAGRRFDSPPPLEVFDPAAFAEYVGKESKLIMDAVYRDTPEPIRQAKADAAAKAQMGGLFGKFGIFDGKTYIVPKAIEAAAEHDQAAAVDMAKIVIAHELTHALQNQEYDARDQLQHLIDLDQFHVWSSVSEGGANYVAVRVARDLGLEAEFWDLTKEQGWGPDGLDQPLAYPIWMRYGRGMTMLEEVVAAGGMEAFWKWHAAPPVSSSMIFRPETYSTELPARALDLPEVLRGTEQQLTRADWMTSNTRLGEFALRGDAIRTGKEAEFEPLLAHLVDAQHLDLSLPDRSGDIRVLVFDSPDNAGAYLELLRAEQTVEGQLLAKMLGVTVEVTYAEVKGVSADATLLRSQFVPIGDGRFREERTAWAQRGPYIVAVKAARFRPGLRLANTLNAVLERL